MKAAKDGILLKGSPVEGDNLQEGPIEESGRVIGETGLLPTLNSTPGSLTNLECCFASIILFYI
jgi:hypothetical protein